MPVGNTYQIYIPTWGRIGNTSTLDAINNKRDVIVVVRPEEEKHYTEQGWDVMVLPPDCIGLGAAQQYIFHNSMADLCWLVDDDLLMDNLLAQIHYASFFADKEKAGIFGLGKHFMQNQRIEKDGNWSRQGSCDRVWGINREMYKASGLDSTPFPILCDLYVWVGMQVAGYGALISNQYIVKGGNAKGGGCEDDQTKDKIIDGIYRLQAAFPEYISIHESDRASIQNMKVGLGFRVAWKRIHQENFKPN